MRNILLFSVLLLGASWMVAQSSTGTGQDQGAGQGTASGQSAGQGSSTGQSSAGAGQASGQKTVTGCLSQANGQYMLTSRKGMTYQLMGDSSQLADHVGHEIKVTGTESGAGASGTDNGNGMGQTSANGPSIQVSSIKHISKTCKTGGNMGNSGGTGGMSH